MIPVIIIPAYQPSTELSELVEALVKNPQQRLIVVNDGSTGESKNVFSGLQKHSRQVEVLHHATNLGKGQALKTGFNHFLIQHPADCVGVVTADADGQHSAEDVLSIANALQQNPNSICLGSRKFSAGIPLKSAIGNRLTAAIFRLVTGVALSDTQTGLRGIPRDFLLELLHSSESGYDFELDMLIRATKNHRDIVEIPIQTIYIANNKNSHFNVLRDSLKIYFVFVRFSLLSLSTSAIDYLVFALVFWNTHEIFKSIAIARVVAGLFQFTVGKFWVFKSKGNLFYELIKYTILVFGLMILSYSLISPLVNNSRLNPYLAKIIAEGTIFLLSFAAQRILVFSSTVTRYDRTNWDAYYSAPFKTAAFSRKLTERRLHGLISAFGGSPISQIVEMGGGNSCFFQGLRAKYPNAIYTIIDNNQHGLDLFQQKHSDDPAIRICNHDVLEQKDPIRIPADIAFSIGLVEHFPPQATARAINAHFSCVKPGGIVIITFPTPTWLYVIARRLTELAGAWRFPDERPLKMSEVIQEAMKYGEIVHTSINWPIVFTQGIVVVREKIKRQEIPTRQA
jgi:glycosyltransferase involved in cell wall biosynthesis